MSERFLDNWTTQLRKGLLALCVLNCIRQNRAHGYDVVRQLRSVHGLVISEGTVYPILSRLKKEGFVTTTIGESHEGPMRKYYDLTPLGARYLDQMNDYWQHIRNGVDTLRLE
jgi:PadR family transcriptional regulator, regulatory protein PadR